MKAQEDAKPPTPNLPEIQDSTALTSLSDKAKGECAVLRAAQAIGPTKASSPAHGSGSIKIGGGHGFDLITALAERAGTGRQKNAQKLKAQLRFVDESGFSQRPPIRATWAPRGRTPRAVDPFNWQRLSGIAVVLTRADGQRPRWLLALRRGSVRSAQVVRFLQALRRHWRRPVFLVQDRLPTHRSRHVQQALEDHRACLRVEWLPAYAPELNLVEQIWAHLDGTALANMPAEDLERLSRRVRSSVRRVNHRTTLRRAFLSHTGAF